MVEFIYKYPIIETSGRDVILSSHATPIERGEFYKQEIERHLQWLPPQFAVEIVNILLCDPKKKQWLIQERSEEKRHNPGLYDKTVGWHLQVLPNNTSSETAQFETLEELRIPSYTFENDDAFQRGYEKFKGLLDHVAILKQIDTKPLIYKRIMKIWEQTEVIDIASKVHVFFGVYEWPVKNNDWESGGFSFRSMESLKEKIAKHPDMYTDDLATLISIYGTRLMEELQQLSR